MAYLPDISAKNAAGVTLVEEFGTSVVTSVHEGYRYPTNFGRNPDIDVATVPEDMWNGSTLYTGFNATAGENISTASASPNDVGSLVSSGTVTSATATTLVDSGATFITDGVVVGDLVIDDSEGSHGVIISLTETELTVHQWSDGDDTAPPPTPGESYRVASAASTGAAVVRWENPLDSS